MNSETLNKLQELATQLSVQLGASSEMIYSKLIWYTKVDGLVNLVGWSIVAVIIVVLNIVFIREAVKEKMKSEEAAIVGIVGLAGNIIVFFVTSAAVATLVNNVTKIIVPEYWVIKTILEGVLK